MIMVDWRFMPARQNVNYCPRLYTTIFHFSSSWYGKKRSLIAWQIWIVWLPNEERNLKYVTANNDSRDEGAFTHGNNGFVERSQILAGYRLEK